MAVIGKELKLLLLPSELPKQPSTKNNIFVMGFSSMVATFGNTLWFYFLPVYYAQVYGASPFEISAIYATWLAIAAFGSTPAGALADSFGRKPIIVLSSLISAFAIFVFALSHNFLVAAIALPISGLGSAFFKVTNTLVAESVEKERRGSAFGTYSTLSGIAAAFSPIIGGITISTKGYLPLFIVGGMLTLVAAFTRARYLKETLPSSQRTPFKKSKIFGYLSGAKKILSNRVLSALVLVYSMYNILNDQYSFIPPLYAREVLDFDPITLGILFSALLAIVAISKWPFGKLSDKIGTRRTVMISWVGEISVVYIFVFAPRGFPAIAVIGMACWMLFGVMDGPAVNAWVAEASDPRIRGLSMGMFYSVTFVPTIPALLVSGYLFGLLPQLPFYANSLVGVIALVLLIVLT